MLSNRATGMHDGPGIKRLKAKLGDVEIGHHHTVDTWTIMVLENIKNRLERSIKDYRDMGTLKHICEELYALDYAIAVIKEQNNADK